MLFLVNPKSKRRRLSGRRTKRRQGRRSKRRRAMPAALKAYWASKRGGKTMARRKRRRHGRVSSRRRRSTTIRINSPRRRRRGRRSFRSNPGFSGRGLVNQAIQGVKCGAVILAGDGLSTMTAGFIPILGNTGIIGGLKIGLVGTLLGTFASRYLGSYTREFVGGAWAKAIKTAVPVASIPLIGPSLAGYTPALIAPSRLSGYAPRGGGAGLSQSTSTADDGSGYVF
jgi:hypothetical protein